MHTIKKIVSLQILSWMAGEVRGRIRKRQREGIKVALQNGAAFS